ncbi:hypothetical protein Strain138_000887 [Pseudogemmatithrix spongiicola]|uniref:Phosphoribulokinase/uridine kinase domain-containing protein n=1 Tax=Pseudogemmatithrix spongiicola TaxID=3062599 RepID=A0AA49JTB2_9BACT|nr:hypothetical protein Strain138_000887 [Gemmatimonadaceae bacterium 'strain 138']WKW14542.1 hypothetical protein Strain318_000887 [Gemmatimonadaceae bacterium 'strain 318']
MTSRSPRPTLCAIIGDHGSGKRRLAQSIVAQLGAAHCAALALDDYAVPRGPDAPPPARAARTPHDASLALMAQHLRLLRQGETVFKPVVDRTSGDFSAPEFVHPTALIVAHGLHGLASPELRALWDVSVFLDSGTADAEAQRFILPQRDRADLVVLRRAVPGRAVRYELRVARPVPMPNLDALRADADATVLQVSSGAAGPDVIAVDGDEQQGRAVVERLVAEYVVRRAAPRTAAIPAEVRSARPAPGA